MNSLYRFKLSLAFIIVILLGVLLCLTCCQSSVPDVTETEPSTAIEVVPLNISALDYCTSTAGTNSSRGSSLANFNTSNFTGSGVCTTCHQNLTDNKGNDVSITNDWRSTMMANAAKDPLWQAKVSAEIAQNPDLKSVIEDKCATCHMPMALTQANTDNLPTGIIDGPFLDTDSPLHTAAIDGVSCTLCHQIQDINLGEQESFSGHYNIDTDLTAPNRLIYGPFPNPLQGQMRNRTGYIPTLGAQTVDSGLCGTCHTLYTPFVDSLGKVAGDFPEQTPYLEWEASEHGDGEGEDTACQDCHMPAADAPAAISTMPPVLSAREPFAKHYFVGGNSFMLEIMKANADELNLTASSTQMDTTIDRTQGQLSENAASIYLDSAERNEGLLDLKVDLVNQTGHKLPTGFPSRRSWIHITVRNAAGEVIFESGKPNPDGSINGNDADADAAQIEPHYQIINDEEQVQIYESIMQDTDNNVTYTLLRGASYVKDNRLTPPGFDKATVIQDIGVYGNALNDVDFNNGEDTINYLIPLNDEEGPLEITLALLYQTTSYQFLNDLLSNDTTQIQLFSDFLNQSCKMPEVISFAAYKIY